MGGEKQTHKTDKIRILTVEDHSVVRQGLKHLINQEPDLLACAEAGSADEAMRAIKQNSIDVAIVDISLKGQTNGIELVSRIKAEYPQIGVLILSMHDESVYVELALRAGAAGYVTKHEAAQTVISAIRHVAGGGVYLSDGISAGVHANGGTSAIKDGILSVDNLTGRELEVFQLMGRGYKTRQIAERLGLSAKTVESYIAHMKDKLELADIVELIQYAIQWTKIAGRT